MEKCEKRAKKKIPLYIFVYLKQTQMMSICKISFRFLENEPMDPENLKTLSK